MPSKERLSSAIEDDRAVPDDVLVELNARVGDLPQKVLERALSLFQGVRPEVDGAQFQQVEGEKGDPVVVSLTVELLEIRRAVEVAADRLAIEDQGARPKVRHCLPNEWKAIGPIVIHGV